MRSRRYRLCPTLKITPRAWAKLVYLRDRGLTEVGGFGISAAADLLTITDIALVPQTCTAVSTSFDDAGVADYFDRQTEAGRSPVEFARIWIHTHPGDSPRPTEIDEETFKRAFADAAWAVMFVLARGGATYARLRLGGGPAAELRIPVKLDFGREFDGSDRPAWNEEYRRNVRVPLPRDRRERTLSLAGVGSDRLQLNGPQSPAPPAIGPTNPTNDIAKSTLSERFSRQTSLVPQEILGEASLTVIGVGAIGRQLAVQAAALGIHNLQLVDFDQVEMTNLTTQGYRIAELGMTKVEACRRALLEVDPAIEVETVADRYRPSLSTHQVVFCAVDSVDARAAIWRAIGGRCRFWCDGRLLRETLRILTAIDANSRAHYAATLFPAKEAYRGSCTAQGAIYAAAIAAGLMLHQFCRHLRGEPTDADLMLNLTASELSVGTERRGAGDVR
jgi:sulfur carrier protein ThiS adenylyltransferase